MWGEVEKHFKRYPQRLKVARAFIELGLRIDADGKIYIGSIEIQPAKIAKALGVDRRVVARTVEYICSNPKIRDFFMNIKPAGPSFRDVAKQFNFSVIEIHADPRKIGIIAGVSSLIAKEGINIRQIIAEDPELYPEPKLLIITEGEVPGRLVNEFLKIDGVKSVELF